MTIILGDGTVIASHLGVEERGVGPGASDLLNNNVLRYGEVRKLIYPDSPASFTQKQVEYEVEVQHRDGDGISANSTYRGITVNNLFGGFADRFEATYREDTSQDHEDDPVGIGSKVVLLCIGGDNNKAIILGGTRDPKLDSRIDKKEAGHNLYFEFNGVRFTIDKDGQPTFVFRGATKADGKLKDSATAEAEGTSVAVTKDGNLTVSTPDQKQFLRLNHADKKIEMLADEDWKVDVNGTINISSGKTVTLTTDQKVKIVSSGVEVGDATDKWLLASTYRDEESNLHTQMASTLSTMQGLCSTAGNQLQIGSKANAAPSTGGAAAAPNFAAAAAALSQLASQFSTLSNLIKQFESKSNKFLSQKNLND